MTYSSRFVIWWTNPNTTSTFPTLFWIGGKISTLNNTIITTVVKSLKFSGTVFVFLFFNIFHHFEKMQGRPWKNPYSLGGWEYVDLWSTLMKIVINRQWKFQHFILTFLKSLENRDINLRNIVVVFFQGQNLEQLLAMICHFKPQEVGIW